MRYDKWVYISLFFLVASGIVIGGILLGKFSGSPDTPDVSDVPIRVGEDLTENEYFSSLRSLINEEAEKYVFVYLGDVCAVCKSGDLLIKTNALSRSFPQHRVHVLLSGDYTGNDIENLQHNYNFGVDFAVISEPFQAYIESIFPGQRGTPLVGMAFIVNREGKVIHVDLLKSDPEDRFRTMSEAMF